MVPEDHILRVIDRVLDFTIVRKLAKPRYSHTGKPSVDPVVLFKMWLVGYLFGITKERRLCREIELNLAYRWFIGYEIDEDIPTHSVLSKARNRFGAKVFKAFFAAWWISARSRG
jgi:transposase